MISSREEHPYAQPTIWVLGQCPLRRAVVAISLARIGLHCATVTTGAPLDSWTEQLPNIGVLVVVLEDNEASSTALAQTQDIILGQFPWAQIVTLLASSAGLTVLPRDGIVAGQATPRGRSAIRYAYLQAITTAMERAIGLREKHRTLLAYGGEVSPTTTVVPGTDAPTGTNLRGCLSVIGNLERLRRVTFGDVLPADPAWSMIVQLLHANVNEEALSVSALCAMSRAPETTALRRIFALDHDGIIDRVPDDDDKRRHFVQLTPDGAARVGDYLLNATQLLYSGSSGA